ncbi:MAG TPA: HNH endonuclease signature motif containing protein [Anaerolineae bacterium]|nr:HNH endonuclease signature motif containing protein [Anaerolineae bacterium]
MTAIRTDLELYCPECGAVMRLRRRRPSQDWKDRYWEKVDVRGKDECWEWVAGTNSRGYGQLQVDGKSAYAHRLAWELENGPIPEELCVLHRCDNRNCVNPAHLWLGTNADNSRDMVKKGRPARGAEHAHAKLTRQEVQQIRHLYSTGEYLQRELGKRFGVSESHVSGIVNRKYWAWLN